MIEITHAPGPWTVARARSRTGADKIIDADGNDVGTVNRWTPACEANGITLAAAPALLKALNDIVEHSPVESYAHAVASAALHRLEGL